MSCKIKFVKPCMFDFFENDDDFNDYLTRNIKSD